MTRSVMKENKMVFSNETRKQTIHQLKHTEL
ncbi:alpha-glycerophosphate oxidase, partial [Vibrio parahaemolyticus]